MAGPGGRVVTWYMAKPTRPHTGMVTTQAMPMSRMTPHLTVRRDATPTPMIEVAAAWVVEIGMPAFEAPKIAVVAPMFADSPLAFVSRVIFRPIVSMMAHPPQYVPREMTPADAKITQSGTG